MQARSMPTFGRLCLARNSVRSVNVIYLVCRGDVIRFWLASKLMIHLVGPSKVPAASLGSCTILKARSMFSLRHPIALIGPGYYCRGADSDDGALGDMKSATAKSSISQKRWVAFRRLHLARYFTFLTWGANLHCFIPRQQKTVANRTREGELRKSPVSVAAK